MIEIIAVLEQAVRGVGLPIAMCIVFLWIIIDSYLEGKHRTSKHLDKQTAALEKVKHCSERTVEILEQIDNRLDALEKLVERNKT